MLSRALATEELELARAYGALRPIGIALRVCGRLAVRGERFRISTEAVDVLSRSGAELEHARALVELGTALRVAGKRTTAAQTLFVTAKTVETHLGHACTKLGVGSPVELDVALAGELR